MYEGLREFLKLEMYLCAGNTHDHDEFTIHCETEIYIDSIYFDEKRGFIVYHRKISVRSASIDE